MNGRKGIQWRNVRSDRRRFGRRFDEAKLMPKETTTIERCRIQGYKSIRDADIPLGRFNIVVGANGAGKSNLVSFFSFLNTTFDRELNWFVGRRGGPNAFLHLGSKITSEIVVAISVTTESGKFIFRQRHGFQAPDSLIYSGSNKDSGSNVSAVVDICRIEGESAASVANTQVYLRLANGVDVYHFNDTSLNSAIRTAGDVEDNRSLRWDGGNLAAYLYLLQQTDQAAYQRIVGVVRQIVPFFDNFSLAPRALDPTRILLNWRQIDSDHEFGPHQLSDGTLRAMALVTLLLRPEVELPLLLVVDEPETGLHPYALSVIGSLLRKASHHSQVIVATQSPQLLDECDPEDIICVDRKGPESIFSRPDPDKLRAWLDDYTLGEVWRKNVIGAGPH
ncbi:MAG: AAA family ATPase [Planctomycetia bacterium]